MPARRPISKGQLAPKAATLPVPKEVTLKDAKAWKIIGKPIKRLDTPAKVTGKAEYGIDVQLPGLLIASLAQCPVLGGKPLSVDDTKAKTMPGVKAVVKNRRRRGGGGDVVLAGEDCTRCTQDHLG